MAGLDCVGCCSVCDEACRALTSCDCVVCRFWGSSAPMSMLKNRERGRSSSGGGRLLVRGVEWWREGMGLMGLFPSDVDVSASASRYCGMRW